MKLDGWGVERKLCIVVSVSLYAAEIQGGFQCVELSALHATESLGALQTVVTTAKLPYVQRNSWDTFRLCCFQGGDKLVINCSVALCADDLLECLRLWCQ